MIKHDWLGHVPSWRITDRRRVLAIMLTHFYGIEFKQILRLYGKFTLKTKSIKSKWLLVNASIIRNIDYMLKPDTSPPQCFSRPLTVPEPLAYSTFTYQEEPLCKSKASQCHYKLRDLSKWIFASHVYTELTWAFSPLPSNKNFWWYQFSSNYTVADG